MNNHAQAAFIALFVLCGCGDQPTKQKEAIAVSSPAAEDSSDRREESTEEESEGFAPDPRSELCAVTVTQPAAGAPADLFAIRLDL